MEIEEPFKTGFLFTPPQSFLRKSWAKRFCALYHASIHGIQRLEIFDSDNAFLQSKSPLKIIPLTDCVKVTPAPQKQQANVFEVCTRTGVNQFSADSFQEMTEWLNALRTSAFGGVHLSSGPSILTVTQDVMQEENLLYSSVNEPEVYSVRSLNTDAMIRNNLSGEYKLVVTATSLFIAESSHHKLGRTLFTWPYRHIRRYGFSKDNFSFEAGRKCVSGEGLFAFSTADGRAIFETVDSHLSQLKMTYVDGEVPSSPLPVGDKSGNIFSNKQSPENKAGYSGVSQKFFPPNQEKSDRRESDGIKSETSLKTFKPGLPISKPPRKSKQNTSDLRKDGDVGNRQMKSPSKVLSNVSLGMYDDVEGVSGSDSENLHFDEKCQVSETKLHESHSEKFSPECSEPVYAVLEESAFRISNPNAVQGNALNSYENVSNDSFKLANEKPAFNSPCRRESDFYDHLSLKKFDINHGFPSPNNSSDHVYGKLITNRPSSVGSKNNHDNPYGSVSIKNKMCDDDDDAAGSSGHSYSNVDLRKFLSPAGRAASTPSEEPKHFLRNNAEYAKVSKNKK